LTGLTFLIAFILSHLLHIFILKSLVEKRKLMVLTIIMKPTNLKYFLCSLH
jgi:hypothetical protein